MKNRIDKSELSNDEDKMTANQVSKFLEANPDFFLGRENLLLKLSLPTRQGTSVSLVERQLSALRDRNTELRHRLDQLVGVAWSNDKTFTLCRKLTLSLIAADTSESFIQALQNSLLQDFNCDTSRLILTGDSLGKQFPSVIETTIDELKLKIPAIAATRRPILGTLRPDESRFLFNNDSSVVQSAAVLPLDAEIRFGLLAVGSREPDRFSASLNTMFLDFIAEVLIRLLPKFIDQNN